MRDGTTLYADVYRPDNQQRYPAVLTRLPYNKNVEFPTGAGYLNPITYARAGYAVVIQDVRGTGASEGSAVFWRQEIEDGYDSVESIATQPWCDGNVGMIGFSYFGYTQWAAAVAQPPHLKAICPAFTNTIPHAFPYTLRGDKFGLQTHSVWALMMSNLLFLRSDRSPGLSPAVMEKLIHLADHKDELFRLLPLPDSPIVQTVDELGMVPSFVDLLSQADDAEFWQKIGGPLPLEKVNAPALHIAGWYDTNTLPAVINSYLALARAAAEKGARPRQKLIIGPWIHSAEMVNKIGELDLGQRSSGAVENITGQQIRWFDRWLKGLAAGAADESPVRIFVMGENRWRNENEWPLARAQYREYYFHSQGHANTRSGNGSLSPAAPSAEPFDSFVYDPRNPVPSHILGPGAYDQWAVEDRPDVLVYTSEPLTDNLEVTGPIKVNLWAASSAVDTDFTAKLVDVWPDGRAYNLAEGITRAGYQPGKGLQPIVPGEVNRYLIDLGATSNVFKAGHRVRVEISSSEFPKWDRNLNTGEPIAKGAEIKLALQSIFHQVQFASHIVLPVISS